MSSAQPTTIAKVIRHRVRRGDTLDNLARAHGLTWQQLARFNFGTDVPREINLHLRDQVGCTHKTADGNNYIFDDSDDPGIILIPQKFELDSRHSDRYHIIKVRKPPAGEVYDVTIPVEFDLDDDPDVEDQVRLKSRDDSFELTISAGDSAKAEKDPEKHLVYYHFEDVPVGVYVVQSKIGKDWVDILQDLHLRNGTLYHDGGEFTDERISEVLGTPAENGEVWDDDEDAEQSEPDFLDYEEESFAEDDAR